MDMVLMIWRFTIYNDMNNLSIDNYNLKMKINKDIESQYGMKYGNGILITLFII